MNNEEFNAEMYELTRLEALIINETDNEMEIANLRVAYMRKHVTEYGELLETFIPDYRTALIDKAIQRGVYIEDITPEMC